jgi:hypothetical protein
MLFSAYFTSFAKVTPFYFLAANRNNASYWRYHIQLEASHGGLARSRRPFLHIWQANLTARYPGWAAAEAALSPG